MKLIKKDINQNYYPYLQLKFKNSVARSFKLDDYSQMRKIH